MIPYDFIMILVLVGATLFGVYKGLAWQVASIGSIVVSYFVACNFRGPLAAVLQAKPPWNQFLAMLILYLGTSLAVWVGFRMVKSAIDRVKLQEFDRQLGGLLGAAKGVLLCVIITMFAVALLDKARQQEIINSRSGLYIAQLLDKSDSVMPAELHQVLHPFLHALDEDQNFHTDHPGEHSEQAHGQQPSGRQEISIRQALEIGRQLYPSR